MAFVAVHGHSAPGELVESGRVDVIGVGMSEHDRRDPRPARADAFEPFAQKLGPDPHVNQQPRAFAADQTGIPSRPAGEHRELNRHGLRHP